MSDMYKKIKKQNGEAFAQGLRNYHNGLLEIPDIDKIVRHAGRDAAPLLPYLMTLLAANDDAPAAPAVQDPFVLLDQAGYDTFHADTLQKQNSIAKYFQQGELLCTFNDSARYKNYHIVHAVRKDVDTIQRADFTGKEKREDTYGTSVISIQMLKKGGFISIKNRYNHAVNGCDNTFNSNPDNIIEGLSAALKEHFNVEFTVSERALPEGYVVFRGKIFKYHSERNNIYYGDRVYGCDGILVEINTAAGDAMFDELWFDNASKTLKKINLALGDSFADDFNRCYGGNRGLTVRNGNLMLGDDVLISAERSRITAVYLPALTTMGDSCLRYAHALTQLSAPALTTMGNDCLSDAYALTEFSAPNLATMGRCCLYDARALTHFSAPALTAMSYGCFSEARALTQLSAPALTTMGSQCFSDARALTQFTVPALTTMGDGCFSNARALTYFSAPSLITMGDGCLRYASALTQLSAPALTTMGGQCFSDARALTQFTAPALTTMGDGCFSDARALAYFSAPALTTMGDYCLYNAGALKQFEAQSLTFVPDHLKRFIKERETKLSRLTSVVLNEIVYAAQRLKV